MNQTNENISRSPKSKKKKNLFWWFMAIVTRLVLPLLIIAAGVVYAKHLVETSPKTKRNRPPRQARLVEVSQIPSGDFTVQVTAMGTVIPAREVDIKPQVSGKIIRINPELIPGGLFRTGQSLMKIEPDDYELRICQIESEVATAQSNLKLELGNQALAKQEYELLGDVISADDKELVLRQPQLVSLQSRLQSAQAQLRLAQLNLARTDITAPFNAIVKQKYIDLGTTVSLSTTLVSLTGTDEYWIELKVPVDQLKWIEIPRQNQDTGSLAKIFNSTAWPDSLSRQGRVLRLKSDVESKGRMANLLVSVKDPLALNLKNKNTKPLLIGSFVNAVIEGQKVFSVFKLNREFLRDGDKVWLLTPDNTLEIRPVKVVFHSEDYVLIAQGLSSQDQVITTNIAAAVEGMLLRLPDSQSVETTDKDIRKPSPKNAGKNNHDRADR